MFCLRIYYVCTYVAKCDKRKVIDNMYMMYSNKLY